MPEPQLRRACTCGGGCPTCRTEQTEQEHERLQTEDLRPDDVGQHLQGSSGERPVGRLSAARKVIQPKLEVGAVDDPLEREADRVADQVMRMPEPDRPCPARDERTRRQPAEENEEELQPKRIAHATAAEPGGSVAPPLVESVLREPGRPLDPDARAFMEPRFGQEFANVHVHTDQRAAESARAIGALAYTVGRHIVFGQGRYAPHHAGGQRLLAHELTHVLQQSGPTIRRDDEPPGRGLFGDWRLEFVGIPPLDLPIVGNPRAGLRRNPDGTWTMIVGNEDHMVSPDEVGEILEEFKKRKPGRPAGADVPIGADDPLFDCPPGQYVDLMTLRCRDASRFERPWLELREPELRLPRRGLRFPESVTIDRFDVDSAEVPESASEALDRLAEVLNRVPQEDVWIEGHTDATGTESHNLDLSERRAAAVKAALEERGVAEPARLKVRGYGEEVPRVPAARSDAQRARNRRVEVWYPPPPGESRLRLDLPGLLPGP